MDGKSKELVERYLKFCSGLSETTIANYKSTMNIFLNYYEDDDVSFENLTIEDIIEFFEVYEASRNTKIYRLRSLNRFYHWANKHKHIIGNPVKSFLNTLKPDKKERDYLTQRQSGDLLRNIIDINFYIFTMFFIKTGVRVSEFQNILLDDVDFTEKTIFIRGGKGRKDRYVFFDSEMGINLKRWLRERDILKPKAPNLFLNRRGKAIGKSSITHYIRYLNDVYGKKVNKRITPHILRHTFATTCVDKGMDLRTLQDILGHEDIKTTSIYLHKNKESLKREYLRVMGR
ncbi:tyrosine recombinase XerC [Methanococcus maripaludis]|uniref:tyrosine-type recombinase/integrase n=1 Tax=Methanococcus maripaludis TaxID=39152 RepID=UPI0031412D5C